MAVLTKAPVTMVWPFPGKRKASTSATEALAAGLASMHIALVTAKPPTSLRRGRGTVAATVEDQRRLGSGQLWFPKASCADRDTVYDSRFLAGKQSSMHSKTLSTPKILACLITLLGNRT
jgi:hypothetical protein